MLASAIVAVLFFVNSAPELQAQLDQANNLAADMKQAAIGDIAKDWSGTILNWGIILLIASAAVVILYTIYKFVMQIIENPKSGLRSLASLALIGVVVLIAFLIAKDSIPPYSGADENPITASTSRWIGTELFTMYLFFGLTIIAAIYAEIAKIFK